MGTGGMVGVNLFYRNVRDMIEQVALLDPTTDDTLEGSEGPGTILYQPQNVGKAKGWSGVSNQSVVNEADRATAGWL